MDDYDCLYQVHWRMQTAVWFNDQTGKWQYVSIFPHFIKRYCSPSLDLLEYISCTLGKGEDVFRHIDDPEEILDSEDRIYAYTVERRIDIGLKVSLKYT